jgi:hypothetical protein
MHSVKRFPSRDADFLMAVNIIIDHLNQATNKPRLITTTAAKDALTEATLLIARFDALMLQSQNPAETNTIIVNEKKTVRTRLDVLLQIIYTDIPRSVLTPTDRSTLNIPEPAKTHTRASVPTLFPSIKIKKQTHMAVTFQFSNALASSSTRMPPGVANIHIEYAVVVLNENGNLRAPTDDDYRHGGLSGRTQFTFTYTDEKVGKMIYVRACYLNTRNQRGPWSLTVTLILI